MLPKVYPMIKSLNAWTRAARSSAYGVSVSSRNVWRAWKNVPDRVAPGLFPPELVVQVKALACELPTQHDVPLSRWSLDELTLHLCQRQWEGKALQGDEFVISADEKTSVQARRRIHPTLPPQPDRPMKVEHEYERLGAWAYLAAMDVHAPKLFGRCEATSGIAPFDRLVAQAMAREPYRSARRVFWIMDNGSSHRGQRSVQRLQSRYPNLRVVHGPIHASLLNQIEIYFSIIQRKVLTPNDFNSLEMLADRLQRFERHYEIIAKPFEWKFTREDLNKLVNRLDLPVQPLQTLAA